MDVHTVDLHFQGTPQVIACYVIEATGGLVIVDPGPYSTWDRLTVGLDRLGYRVEDVRHVLLTHIHFDHAGAAWAFAQRGAQIHVHPLGYGHLLNPARLWRSAARIYGDAAMETLWGEMQPVGEARLGTWSDGETTRLGGLSVTAHHSPGHAKHHIAWQVGGEALFLGDVGGVRIERGPVEPPCPPPDIDIEAWRGSIARLRGVKGVSGLYPTHFGRLRIEANLHFDELLGKIDRWSEYIRENRAQGREQLGRGFEAMVDEERRQTPTYVSAYRLANPTSMSVDGLLRYWEQRGE